MTELLNLSNESSPKNHSVGRPNKDIYLNERLQVVDKLNKILGLDDINDNFILFELENNEDKQKQIYGLENDIKNYFKYAKWSYFNGRKSNKGYLSILKSIYKSMNYSIFSKSYKIKKEDKLIHTKKYFIVKKNI
jgi:hypothetical protein